jgi:cyclin-dependent kinase 9
MFTIQKSANKNNFSEVFKARCKRTGQLVALKKILMENEKEGVSLNFIAFPSIIYILKFPITALREIKMLKLLRHPNITELIEVCTCKRLSLTITI